MRLPYTTRLAFVSLVIAEVAVMVLAVRWLGGWVVFWLLLATSLLGGWLIRNEGVRAWASVVEAVRAGRAPDRNMAASRAVITGGFLLVLPGFVTDLIGAALIIPATRPRTAQLLSRFRPARRLRGPGRTSPQDGNVIKGEIVEPDDPL